jgi:hypothetical protein
MVCSDSKQQSTLPVVSLRGANINANLFRFLQIRQCGIIMRQKGENNVSCEY